VDLSKSRKPVNLLWICCTTCCITSPQQIEQVEFELNGARRTICVDEGASANPEGAFAYVGLRVRTDDLQVLETPARRRLREQRRC
jgi:hypothetical protein